MRSAQARVAMNETAVNARKPQETATLAVMSRGTGGCLNSICVSRSVVALLSKNKTITLEKSHETFVE
ncbi:Uncharacterised protein [Mycobacteroides abscessus subsp. abscessus]|nr:Uncharacterised protein [Mycobacteroides abscessus subsp. abscessus]